MFCKNLGWNDNNNDTPKNDSNKKIKEGFKDSHLFSESITEITPILKSGSA